MLGIKRVTVHKMVDVSIDINAADLKKMLEGKAAADAMEPNLVVKTVTASKSVEVESEVDIDLDEIIDDMGEDELLLAVESKKGIGNSSAARLQRIYEEFRRRGDAPQILKDYLYDALGRIL